MDKKKAVVLLSGGLDSCVVLHLVLNSSIIPLSLSFLYGQTNPNEVDFAMKMPGEHKTLLLPKLRKQGDTYPGRNAIFLSHAASFGISPIFIGCNYDDSKRFADCTEEFLTDMAKVLKIEIKSPLIRKTKKEVVFMAKDLGIDLENTMSCYYGTNCQICAACVLRSKHV